MTGGIIPLAATLASDAVFKAFIGDSKVLYCLQIADIFGTWLCLCVTHVYKHSNHVLSTHFKGPTSTTHLSTTPRQCFISGKTPFSCTFDVNVILEL